MLMIFKDVASDMATIYEAQDCAVTPQVGDFVKLGGTPGRHLVVETVHVFERGMRQVINVHVTPEVAGRAQDDVPYISAVQARTYTAVGRGGVVFGYTDIEAAGQAVSTDFNVYSIRSNVGRYRRGGLIDRLSPGRFKLTNKGASVFKHNSK